MKINLIFILILACFELSAIGAWQQKANFGGIGRHRGTAFAINEKGYMGLGHINSVVNIALADIWEYDPVSNSWTQKADFGGGGRYHNFAFSVNNKAYLGAGRDAATDYSDMWEYDPVTNVWTQMGNFPGGNRLGVASFIINGEAYVGGGVGGANDQAFWKYNPVGDSWTPIADFPGNPRNTGVAFAIDGKGYFGTGNGSFGSGNDFWEYKPSFDLWVQRANVGPTLREGATGFAIAGRGYILTGNNFGTGENFRDVWEFNPGANSWTQLDNFPGSRRRFMVSFVIGDRAYCGTGTNGINFNDFWRFDPALADPPEQGKINAPLDLEVYPNPAPNKVYFRLTNPQSNDSENIQLHIFDISGRLLSQQDWKGETLHFERGRLQAGLYFYQIRSGNEILKSSNFIFQ